MKKTTSTFLKFLYLLYLHRNIVYENSYRYLRNNPVPDSYISSPLSSEEIFCRD